MQHPILIVSICLVMMTASAQTSLAVPAQEATKPAANAHPKSDKIKRQVRKIGTAAKITVELTSTRDYHGTIKWIDEDSFQIDEVDLNKVVTVNYDEVKKVYEGYGGKGINGHRVNPKKGIIAVAIFAGVLATVLIVGKVGY